MLIIGIAGGTGSGKTTVVNKIISSLPQGEVAVLPQDSYYRDLSAIPYEERTKVNFDEPAAIEWELLVKQLNELKLGKEDRDAYIQLSYLYPPEGNDYGFAS